MQSFPGIVGIRLASDCQHHTEFLDSRGFQVELLEQESDGSQPDVVVTDRALSRVLAAQDHAARPGVITIGVEEASDDIDVKLRADVSSREVATAVELVLQIVALRRQRDAERVERERWTELAMFDALTGLPNRRAWEGSLARFCDNGQNFCLALIDVDFFKTANERGQEMGDAVLREIAVAMRARLRDGDIVARIGGDEFAMLLVDVEQDSAQIIVDRMRGYIAMHLRDAGLPSLTVSAGYLIVDQDTPVRTSDLLYRAASRSLAVAKRQQRNCSVAYTAAFEAEFLATPEDPVQSSVSPENGS